MTFFKGHLFSLKILPSFMTKVTALSVSMLSSGLAAVAMMSAFIPTRSAPRCFSTPSRRAAFVVKACKITRAGMPASTQLSIVSMDNLPREYSFVVKITSGPKTSVTPILMRSLDWVYKPTLVHLLVSSRACGTHEHPSP